MKKKPAVKNPEAIQPTAETVEEKTGTPPPPVKRDENLPAMSGAWGASETNDQNDILVSKLHLQQAISKLVDKGAAQAGDWCDSVTEEVVCKKGDPLSVIVIHSYKNLLVFKLNKATNKFDWLRTEKLTAENANKEWEESIDGETYRNQIQYNYFCLLPGRLDELPFVLSMRSTNVKAAKKLNTFFAKLSRLGKPSAAYVFELHGVKVQNDFGTWIGFEPKQGRATTEEEIKTAFEWYQIIKAQSVTVAEDRGESEPSGNAGADVDGDDISF